MHDNFMLTSYSYVIMRLVVTMFYIVVVGLLSLTFFAPGQVNSQSLVVTKAVVILQDATKIVSGRITFSQQNDKVTVTGFIVGLSRGDHGFHVHQYGNLTDQCTSDGPHFSLNKENHGGPRSQHRHTGDLGNIRADTRGRANINIIDGMISLNGLSSIIGRSLVVHEKVDDLGVGGNQGSKTTGNSGARLACGVIGIAEERRI